MKQINWSSLRRLNSAEIRELMPVEVLFEGEPLAVLAPISDMIVISDLHPRVQQQLKAREQLARSGMPIPVRVEEMEPVAV